TTGQLTGRSNITCHFEKSPLHATFLRRTTAVVRNRCDVSDVGNFVPNIVQRANSRFAARARPFHFNIEVLQAVLFGGLTSTLCSHLGSKGSTFTRTAET